MVIIRPRVINVNYFSLRVFRIFLSISSARDSSSFRYLLTLSFPCPNFLSPYEKNEPLFIITSCSTPRSIQELSLLIPSENIISISAFLKGGATLFFTILALTLLPTISVPLFMGSTLLKSIRTEL